MLRPINGPHAHTMITHEKTRPFAGPGSVRPTRELRYGAEACWETSPVPNHLVRTVR